jgi:tripartite-type tricarboxylate transporter receptor subunit TctC
MRRREFIFALGGAATALATPLRAVAQDYANRAVTLVVNFPPGGSTDAMARILREP